MRRLLISTTCLVSLSAATAYAQTAPQVALQSLPSIEEIVVTATRSPQPLYRIGKSITVIDAAAIKASQQLIVSDLITQTPGVSFSRNGGVGGTTSLRIRGAETDQTVVVIDGVKLNDPSSPGGGYNFANMMIGDIDHIEILRGAQSTLWGSQAIGGVVSMTTVTPAKPFEASVDAEGGSFHTGYLRTGIGGADGRLIWRLAGGYYTTDGVSAFSGGTERDGYHDTGASGRLQYDLTDQVSVDVRAVYSYARNDFDGFPPPFFSFADTREYGTTAEFVGYAGLNFDLLGGRLKNRVAYGYTDTKRDNYNPDQTVTTKTFDSAGHNNRIEYQGTAQLAPGWTAVFGAESEKSSLTTSSPSSFVPNPAPLKGNVTINSGYAQVQGEIVKGLTLTGGLRDDDHATFGNRVLGQAAAAWLLNDGTTVLRASFGQGFKAPTLYQLYSEYGNTRLKPEEANSWDAGVEQHLADGRVVLSATWFKRTSTNLIAFVSCPSADPLCTVGRFGVYENTAKSSAQGAELAASAEIDKLTLQANYTYTDGKNTSPGDLNFGKQLTRRPKNAANFSATYTWPMEISTGVAVRYVGDSYDNASNTFLLKNYTLVDLRASVPINQTFEIYGRIENLFDKSYATTRNYNSLGRGFTGGLRARF